MIRRPPRSPLFPYPPLFRPLGEPANTAGDVPGGAAAFTAATGGVGTAQITIGANDAMSAGAGGQIAFGARFVAASTQVANLAIIGGFKENAASGDLKGYLLFTTRNNAAGFVEGLRITSTQQVNLSSGYANYVTVVGSAASGATISTGAGVLGISSAAGTTR